MVTWHSIQPPQADLNKYTIAELQLLEAISYRFMNDYFPDPSCRSSPEKCEDMIRFHQGEIAKWWKPDMHWWLFDHNFTVNSCCIEKGQHFMDYEDRKRQKAAEYWFGRLVRAHPEFKTWELHSRYEY
jgi:hypothetical protein